MKRHPVYRIFWLSTNILLVLAAIAFVWGAVWEYSTRQYLKGFSDAIIPYDAIPEHKVEAILAWMAHGPARRTTQDPTGLPVRDPIESLNSKELLEICGSATNAFVNLAESDGLPARRLLLLDSHRLTTHVVAEVKIGDRWIIVDPVFRFMARDASGRLLTRADLQDPNLLRQVTEGIPGYLPIYTYNLTAHVRVSHIPLIGPSLRRGLDWIWPRWEEAFDWTLLLERDSFALFVIASIALIVLVLVRLFVGQYGEKKLGITRIHLRRQVWQASVTLLGNHRH